jgi:hypothetical protein
VKFSFAYVKSNPVMFGVIFVVFGLLLWMLLNKGHSSGSTQYVASGPSEALQATALQAGTQVQLAQIGNAQATQMGAIQLEALSRQLEGQQNLAVLETQFHTLELASNERMGDKQIEASLGALQAQLNNNLATTESNNGFMVDYARVAADSATNQIAINASLQRAMSQDQLEAYEYGTDAAIKNNLINASFSQIQFMKKRDRDDTTKFLAATLAPSTLALH